MEVEIKLRLPNRDAHAQVAELLKPHFRELHQQENFFFDGTSQEMSKAKLALRTRFYGVDKHAVITLKGRQSMQNGVGVATEQEEDVDPIEARTFLDHPDKLLQLQNSPIMESVRKQQQPKGLVCLGGFRNIRGDYDYEGLKLELDETIYEWGTCFEIEVETPDPEPTKAKLEALLKANDVPYKYNKTTKFANFRKRTLD